MERMIVKQECFRTLKEFDKDPKFRKGSNNPGVYLWGFSLEKSDYTVPSNSKMFFPYYVGKVEKEKGCMYARTQEHLGSIMGGNLSIFNILTCSSKIPITPIGIVHLNYQKVSKGAKILGGIGPNLPDPVFPDLLHFPEGIHRMLHFTTDKIIKAQIDWMLKHFCITYFKLDKYNKFEIIALEKFIGNIIGYDSLITKRFHNPNLDVEIIDNKSNIKINNYEDLFKRCRGQITGVKFGI